MSCLLISLCIFTVSKALPSPELQYLCVQGCYLIESTGYCVVGVMQCGDYGVAFIEAVLCFDVLYVVCDVRKKALLQTFVNY